MYRVICKFLTAAAFPKAHQTVFDNALKTTSTRFRTCLDVTRTRACNNSQQTLNAANPYQKFNLPQQR